MTAHVGSLRFAATALSEAIRPRPPTPFRAWLPKNIVLVDGEKRGELWSEADAPYLGEIADCLSQEHPCNLVTVRKSQQTGVSILALSWALYIAEICPDNVLYGVPGIDALQDANGQKMQPMIDAWQKATDKKIIAPAKSRDGSGSTTYKKIFPGGVIDLANANSVMNLSGKTSRYGVKDEFSKWENTPNGDDPDELFFGRFTAFRRLKSYKILELSTPEIDSGDELGDGAGHCRVDRSFRRSDQRFWHIRCPQCRHEFVQTFDLLVIDRDHPHKTVLGCPDCHYPINEMERVAAVRAGRFIPTLSGPDRHPGFHVDAFISLMMSYEAIAENFIAAERIGAGESGIKGFANRTLGLPYALRGNAPDHKRLMERREAYAQHIVPAEGLLFVAGADVQHDGIYVEAVAFSEDRQSWTVAAEFLEGSTDDPNAGAWERLDAFRGTRFLDTFGNDRPIEALAVDAGDGARTTQVYEWCRRRANCYAVKGQHGRGVPAISVPTKKSVKKSGKRQRFGSSLSWPVGTWALKAEFYGNLYKIGLAAGEAKDPPGYCHFGTWLGEEYFLQITAEAFDQKMVRGKLVEEWKKIRRNNHFFDCRVYAMAMAELLGLSKMSRDDWARLRSARQPSRPVDMLSAPSEQLIERHGNSEPASAATDNTLAKKREAWAKRR
ncbi:terminase gpA endonuclease subunit [Mesorhizobium loti]|uniref:terminase gpA endonuclease subunit n=1 Tax=Rhizobium loti TaxID=381 RepID=UPI0003FA07C5|nr:terminase gpA endonuclease subunit [Mesorhizobium loti]